MTSSPGVDPWGLARKRKRQATSLSWHTYLVGKI